jgi:hypothetical protein
VGIETGDSDDEGRCSERDVAERGDGTRMKPKPIIFHFRRRRGGEWTVHKAINQRLRPVLRWVFPQNDGGQTDAKRQRQLLAVLIG